MPRKLSVPGTSDLLRGGAESAEITADPQPSAAQIAAEVPTRRSSSTGRVRHDEKITVYVSRDELVRLEQARLTLRAEHSLAVDRGRIVREAVAYMLDDLQASGEDSELVRRLSDS
ncbi:hypothetical protein GCM10027418_28950 [Mariniluteicoccus endophyticus]